MVSGRRGQTAQRLPGMVEDVVPAQPEEGAPERTSSMLSAFQSGIAAGRLGAGEDTSGGE